MSPQKTINTRAWAEMLLLALIWGGSFLSFSLALSEIGVFTTVAFRIAGGAIILWLYLAWRGIPLPRSPKIWLAFLVMGILNNVIPFSLIAWGQLHIPSGLASILNASTAIFGVLVAAAVFADERLSTRRTIGVSLGFVGVVTAIGPSALGAFDITSVSQLAIVVSSISYAFAAAWARKAFKGLPPQVAAAGMTTAAALFMVPLALFVDGAPSFDYAPATWGALIHLSIVATALAYLLYYRVLDMAGSGNLMLVTLLVAPIAILLGAIVLGEELQPNAYAGFGFLAIGMLVLDGRILKRVQK